MAVLRGDDRGEKIKNQSKHKPPNLSVIDVNCLHEAQYTVATLSESIDRLIDCSFAGILCL